MTPASFVLLKDTKTAEGWRIWIIVNDMPRLSKTKSLVLGATDRLICLADACRRRETPHLTLHPFYLAFLKNTIARGKSNNLFLVPPNTGIGSKLFVFFVLPFCSSAIQGQKEKPLKKNFTPYSKIFNGVWITKRACALNRTLITSGFQTSIWHSIGIPKSWRNISRMKIWRMPSSCGRAWTLLKGIGRRKSAILRCSLRVRKSIMDESSRFGESLEWETSPTTDTTTEDSDYATPEKKIIVQAGHWWIER